MQDCPALPRPSRKGAGSFWENLSDYRAGIGQALASHHPAFIEEVGELETSACLASTCPVDIGKVFALPFLEEEVRGGQSCLGGTCPAGTGKICTKIFYIFFGGRS